MAAVNKAVCDTALSAGFDPYVINVAANGLDRSLLSRVLRMRRVFWGVVKLAASTGMSGKALYMSVSGGYGQCYEVLFCLVARMKKMRLFLHHHSFSYIDRPNLLARILFLSAGRSAVHVGLSRQMAVRLEGAYSIRNAVSVSNAAFLTRRNQCSIRGGLMTIGFLGNICKEKGVFEFLGVCEAAQQQGIDLRGILAGPFQDVHTEMKVRAVMGRVASVEYVGPRYGADKDRFFDKIDVLVFPTRYINEAEPVTIHEAMRAGVPVIAFGRGAIPEIVGDDCGLVVSQRDPFVSAAMNKIRWWQDNPSDFIAASRAAVERFVKIRANSAAQLEKLMVDLSGLNDAGEDAV